MKTIYTLQENLYFFVPESRNVILINAGEKIMFNFASNRNADRELMNSSSFSVFLFVQCENCIL